MAFAEERKRLKTVRWTVTTRTAIRIAMTSSPAQSIPANWGSVLIPGFPVVLMTVAVVRIAQQQTILTVLLAYLKVQYATLTSSVVPAVAKMENAGDFDGQEGSIDTDQNGEAVFETDSALKGKVKFEFCVEDVVAIGLTYDKVDLCDTN